MPLTARQQRYLAKITLLVQAIQEEAKNANHKAGSRTRLRRTAAEAAKMRKIILSERAKGTSAAKLAERFGVSQAYIYMIKG